MHFQESADALTSLFRRVVNVGTRIQLSGIYAKESKLADKRVRHDLENECGERLFVVCLTRLEGGPVRRPALDRRNIHRRRQKIHDGIEKRLDTFVLECGSAQNRRQLDRYRPLPDS